MRAIYCQEYKPILQILIRNSSDDSKRIRNHKADSNKKNSRLEKEKKNIIEEKGKVKYGKKNYNSVR